MGYTFSLPWSTAWPGILDGIRKLDIDLHCVVDLITRIVWVSSETMEIVDGLAGLVASSQMACGLY